MLRDHGQIEVLYYTSRQLFMACKDIADGVITHMRLWGSFNDHLSYYE